MECVSMNNRVHENLMIEEAAEVLRIPRTPVYKLAREGRISVRKVGRHWRFYRPTLKWIAGQASFENKPSNPEKIGFS